MDVVGHQGLATLQMLLPGRVECVKGLVATVREKADAMPDNQILFDGDDIGIKWDSMQVDWFSMFHDVKVGVATKIRLGMLQFLLLNYQNELSTI